MVAGSGVGVRGALWWLVLVLAWEALRDRRAVKLTSNTVQGSWSFPFGAGYE